MTLQVAVAGEIKSGSSVVETVWEDTWASPMHFGPWTVTERGEAIGVDLGSRGLLFALLVADEKRSSPRYNATPPVSSPSLILTAFSHGAVNGPGTATRQLLSEIANQRDVLELPLTLLPMLVRFRDIDDPRSIERVDPDNLAKSFGPDVELTRATIEIVPSGIWPFDLWSGETPRWLFGAPVTRGIEAQLPWLSTQRGYLSGQGKADLERPENNVTFDAFVQGQS
jgi:hypothetical protein